MATKKPLNYKQLNDELDNILAELQNGELDIDQAVKNYERGMEIVGQLQQYLKTAQNKIAKIQAKFDN